MHIEPRGQENVGCVHFFRIDMLANTASMSECQTREDLMVLDIVGADDIIEDTRRLVETLTATHLI